MRPNLRAFPGRASTDARTSSGARRRIGKHAVFEVAQRGRSRPIIAVRPRVPADLVRRITSGYHDKVWRHKPGRDRKTDHTEPNLMPRSVLRPLTLVAILAL